MRFGNPARMTPALHRRALFISIIKQTGWTYEYVQQLSLPILGDFVAYEQAEELYRKTS